MGIHGRQRQIGTAADRSVAAHGGCRPHAEVRLIVGGIAGVVVLAGTNLPYAAGLEGDQSVKVAMRIRQIGARWQFARMLDLVEQVDNGAGVVIPGAAEQGTG